MITVGIDAAGERRRDGAARRWRSPSFFEAVDLDQHRRRRDAQLPSPSTAAANVAAASAQDAGELLGGLHRRLDLIEAGIVGDLLGVVNDAVIERSRQNRRRPRDAVPAVAR